MNIFKLSFYITLQNPPLRTKDFIDFCKKRGLETNENELEFLRRKDYFIPLLGLIGQLVKKKE